MSISFFAPVEANYTDNTVGTSPAFTPTETPSIPGLGTPYVPRHAAGSTMCEAARTDVSHTCPL